MLLNEYPGEHDKMDTKLFYLKEINDYISKGRLQKFLSCDNIINQRYSLYMLILTQYRKDDAETDNFRHRVTELGFEAAMEQLVKNQHMNIDRFLDKNNYFSQPKEVVRDIFYAIKHSDKSRKCVLF